MKKYQSTVFALMMLGICARPGWCDSNGAQPEVAVGQNQPPVAGALETNANGMPKLVVEFQTGHWDFPASYKPTLEAFGKYLIANPQSKAEIIAYADHTGHGPANVILAQKRANFVEKYLETNYAVASDRMTAKGYGEVSDKAHNITTADKQADRRAYGTIISPTPKM
jgi:outer membrane protein OmpA-like peptidoglycan-associated protein